MTKISFLKSYLLTLLFSISLFTVASAENEFPLDPAITYGKLENGLTYYIRENQTPKEKVSIKLIIKDDKKIKGISIELDKSTKLNELDDTILDFQKNTDDKHEIDVRVDIQNTTLHMKRIKKPYLKLATKDGKQVNKKDEIQVKYIDDKD